MDYSNGQETDHANALWKVKKISTQTQLDGISSPIIGYNAFSQGIQVDFDNCQKTRVFTSDFERLELDPEDIRSESIDIQTEPIHVIKEAFSGFKTRELPDFRLVVQGPEILNYQGTKQSAEDIARFWKKDSRMWLWKSITLARKKRVEQRSSILQSIDNGSGKIQ